MQWNLHHLTATRTNNVIVFESDVISEDDVVSDKLEDDAIVDHLEDDDLEDSLKG